MKCGRAKVIRKDRSMDAQRSMDGHEKSYGMEHGV